MAIENIGNMAQLLERYDSNNWTKSGGVEGPKVDFKIQSPAELVEKNQVEKSFGEILSRSVQDVNSLQKEANTAIEKLVTGENKNIQETMLAVEKADIAFRTMNQIRSKVLDAYREIMKMQV